MRGKHKDLDQGDYFDLDKAARQYRASVSGKRLSGRPSTERLGTYPKVPNQEGNPSLSSILSETSDSGTSRHSQENLVHQISAWLKGEKSRRAKRREKRKAAKHQKHEDQAGNVPGQESAEADPERRKSSSSEGSVALEQLADILGRSMSIRSNASSSRHHRLTHHRKLSAIMKRHSTVSSGDESIDQIVPSCEATLDNTKTLAYGAGGPESQSTTDLTKGAGSKRAKKEQEAWATFKYEIVRLTHTLKIKGWRRVPLDHSGEIDAERLSGAMTNAIYVISPPKDLPAEGGRDGDLPAPKNPPP